MTFSNHNRVNFNLILEQLFVPTREQIDHQNRVYGMHLLYFHFTFRWPVFLFNVNVYCKERDKGENTF